LFVCDFEVFFGVVGFRVVLTTPFFEGVPDFVLPLLLEAPREFLLGLFLGSFRETGSVLTFLLSSGRVSSFVIGDSGS